MPVYDLSSGFNSLNQGINSLGQSLQNADKQARLQQLGAKVQAGDYDGASQLAISMGDLNTGLALKQQGLSLKAAANPPSFGSGGVFGDVATGGSPGAATPLTAAGTSPPVASAPASSGGATSSITPDLQNGIAAANAKYPLDPAYLPTTALMESAGGNNTGTSSAGAKGPFQFVGSTAQKYGLQNPNDPVQSADAAAHLAVDNSQVLRERIGRDPTPAELYLAHQQGAGGAAALINNPQKRAGDVVGDAAIAQNGGDPNMPAGQFAQLWINKYNAISQRFGGQMPSRVASAAPQQAGDQGITGTGAPMSPTQLAGAPYQAGPAAGAPAQPSTARIGLNGQPVGSNPTAGGATPPAQPIQVASNNPGFVPQSGAQPAQAAPVGAAPVAIAVPGYKGTFTRAQAEAASDNDDNTPGTDEWDAAAKGAGKSGSATASAPIVSAQGTAPAATPIQGGSPGAPPPGAPHDTQVAGAINQTLTQLPVGDPRRIQFLQQRLVAVQQASLTNPYYKPLAEQIAGQLKIDQDAVTQANKPTDQITNFNYSQTHPGFNDFISKDKTPQGQVNLEYAQKNWQTLGLPDPALIGKDPVATQAWRDYSGQALGFVKGPGVAVSNNFPKAENEMARIAGAGQGKIIADDMQAGNTAPRRIQALSILNDAATAGGDNVGSGPWAEAALAAKQISGELGFGLPDGTPESEVVKKVGFDLATQMVKAISNRPAQQEFIRALQNVPGLEMSQPGRTAMTSILAQEAMNDQKLALLASDRSNWDNWPKVKQNFYNDPANAIMSPFRRGPNGEAVPISKIDVQLMADKAGIKTPGGGSSGGAQLLPMGKFGPSVSTPADAAKMTPGTPITLPDGTQGWAQ